MITNAEIIYKTGVPGNVTVLKLHGTHFWMSCSRYKNGNWHVEVVDPGSTWRKTVWRSIDDLTLDKIVTRLFLPTPPAFGKTTLEFIHVLKALRATISPL